jgi:hypothetical protein
MRRAWALPLYVVSLAAFAVALFRAFVLGGAGEAMSGAHIAIEVVFVALGLFAIWFSRTSKTQGILQ